MSERAMIDIETLGTTPGAAIVSIGAVTFDRLGVGDAELHVSVDLSSCKRHGLHVDQDTVEWWHQQDEQAQAILDGGRGLGESLAALTRWVEDNDPDEIWANSPSFDCVLLASAYRALDAQPPWNYYEQRDVRTLQSLPQWPDGLRQQGTHHDALADARYQARCVSACLARLDKRAVADGGDE